MITRKSNQHKSDAYKGQDALFLIGVVNIQHDNLKLIWQGLSFTKASHHISYKYYIVLARDLQGNQKTFFT